MENADILIIDDSLLVREIIRDALSSAGFAVRVAGSGMGGLAAAEEKMPDLILTDVVLPDLDGYLVCRRVRQMPGGDRVRIVLMTGRFTADDLATGREAGADDFLAKPFEGADVVDRVRMLLAHARGTVLPAIPPPVPPLTPWPPAKRPSLPRPVAAARAPLKTGVTITCFSLKGGVGTTLMATNLAVALAQLWSCAVALVDLDLEQGSAGVFLDLVPKRTLSDLARVYVPGAGSIPELPEFETPHPSGVRLLAAPREPQHAELVAGGLVRTVLRQLKSTFDFLVVDGGSGFGETTLCAFDQTDFYVLPVTGDLVALKAARATLNVLKQLGARADRQGVVLNRVRPRSTLQARDVEQSLGVRLVGQIPEREGLDDFINRGRPIVTEEPDSPIGAALLDLAYTLSSTKAPTGRPRSALLKKVLQRRG